MLKGIFKTKSLTAILASADEPTGHLKRTLGVWQLTLLGIGAIIGAGIFATVGAAAAGDGVALEAGGRLGAGPAIVVSFILTAICCGFCALCYAEFASLVPVSGSAYTYAYATLGELVGWIIGWDLIIEYAIGNVAIAISWAGYFCNFLRGAGLDVPNWLATDYRTALQASQDFAAKIAAGVDPKTLDDVLVRSADAFDHGPLLFGHHIVFNLPAFLIVALVTVVLVKGVRESAWFNSTMVVLKLAIVGFFIVMGFFYVEPKNWHPFAPNGFTGVAQGAAILFFAYIGFDAISTASEEAKNPKRDMPIAILGSLLICTILYIIVGAVLTGLMPWARLNTAEPLAIAFTERGIHWAAAVISLGAIFATTSVLVVFQLGQPRIFFSMARDGLLPQWAAKVHPKWGTPHITTILTGVFVAVLSGVANINEIVDLCNVGTLFAFLLVCIGITILRYTDPTRARGFRVPFGAWLIPTLGAASCVFLMVWLPGTSWWRFVGWLVLGMAVYFSYGYNQSRIGREQGRPARPDAAQWIATAGFLTLAGGMFVLPHDLSAAKLFDALRSDSSAHYLVRHTDAMDGDLKKDFDAFATPDSSGPNDPKAIAPSVDASIAHVEHWLAQHASTPNASLAGWQASAASEHGATVWGTAISLAGLAAALLGAFAAGGRRAAANGV